MDRTNAKSAYKAKLEISKSHNQQGGDCSDACSPFCQCSCCAGFSINHFVASIIYIPPYESITKAAYLPSSVLDVALPIWQPPQLAC